MHIAFITPEYVTESSCFDGGLSNYLHRVAVSLKHKGHEPVIIVASNKNECILHDDVKVYRVALPAIDFEEEGYKKFRMFHEHIPVGLINMSKVLNDKLEELHKKRSFDIVQYASYNFTALFRRLSVPTIVRISSYSPLMRQGYGIDDISLNDKYEDLLELMAIKNVDGVFSPSKILAEVIKQETNRVVDVIESPFYIPDIEYDTLLYDEMLKGKKYLLFFGTVGYLKGAYTIASILYSLLAKNKDLYFVFIGKDTKYKGESVKEKLLKSAKEFRNRVVYIDKIPHKTLYPIIKGAYAVVLPSRIDNFPNTCLEAMGHNKVVIGTIGTSFEQLIIDGENGFLSRVDDSVDLLDKIEYVLGLPKDDLLKIGKKAGERIEKLEPENSIEELILYYKKISKETDYGKTTSTRSNDVIFSEIVNAKVVSLNDIDFIFNKKYDECFILKLIIKKFVQQIVPHKGYSILERLWHEFRSR